MAKEYKEYKAGIGVDSSGNPAVDPTANVLQLVEAAVRRINDLHAQELEFNEKVRGEEMKRLDNLIRQEVKRLDDIQNIQVKYLNDALSEHKNFNKTFYQETKETLNQLLNEREIRLQQKFESLAIAINKAEQATEKRFESVNEFRAVLTSQQNTLLPRVEYDSGHKNLQDLVTSQNKTLSDIIIAQKERIDKIENIKQGGYSMWVIIIGVIGFLTGIISFVLNLLGK